MNERWRVALAGLVAALAIPFLIIDSPSPAEGVETIDEQARGETTTTTEAEVVSQTEVDSSDVVVVAAEFGPDIDRLAERAGVWNAARLQAVADGLVTESALAPPSDTDLSLLPFIPPEEPEPEVPETEPEVPETEPEVDEPELPSNPTPPAQVNGRVPPPAGGPTAAQWDAVRKCESTHNYAAISPSGLYRGAYQFSQQTWDWVAGIHQPHLVGIDPADAEPAWQDIMAYTLYAMRGWDQWPICGKNLL